MATIPIRHSVKREPVAASKKRVVVVHSGARDAYQVSLALSESEMLDTLVTDLFWPADQRWARALLPYLPAFMRALLNQRSAASLSSSRVKLCAATGLAVLALDKIPGIPLSLRCRATRYADATLGRAAGLYAKHRGAGLLSYSYYAYEAFTHFCGSGILFQLHPHPASMRRILTDELIANPECAASLKQEWELALPEDDFQHLVAEAGMAQHYLAASSFTRSTLVENGIPYEAIRVIPYGVDAERFSPDLSRSRAIDSKLRLLFVGRINQRKGIKYLLDAIRLIGTHRLELIVCGRVVDNLECFRTYRDCVKVLPDVSNEDLIAAYKAADIFVFPSVAEGFGQVLLESLACGLPILSTTRTAAPDLIESGRQGFVIDPCSPEQLADRIEWALAHRRQLVEMRGEARSLAETYTWERFRAGVVEAVREALAQPDGRYTASRFGRRASDVA